LNITTEDFMAGQYHFAAPAGEDGGLVVNQGLIEAATGGSVSLIGGAVRNEGVILATAGQVTLAAGNRMAMDFDGDGLIRFVIEDEVLQNLHALDGAVTNTGEINADGGSVVLEGKAARDVFTNVVNNQGIVRAGRIENQGGIITLAASGAGNSLINTGTLDASGTGGDGGTIHIYADDTAIVGGNSVVDASSADGAGGTVQILGEQVGLAGEATLDASGATGGGTVLIGGDYQGKNPDIRNASKTYVGSEVEIRADATEQGDGGKVIVWADGDTEFHGNISVRGGDLGGDGGFVEVSGKGTLLFTGFADRRAPHGEAGTLLLDPTTLDIIASGSPIAGQILDSDLATNLGGGDVILQTSTDGTGAGDGIITFKTLVDVTWTSGYDLTLIADDNLGVNIQNGTVTVESSVIISGDDSGGGETNGADVTIQAGTVNLSSAIGIDGILSGTATAANVFTGGSVQDGIDVIDTGGGGTVTVGDGTFTEDLTISTDNLTLTSANGKANTTIQGVSSLSQASFPVYQGATNILIEANGVTIDDLTLKTPNVAAGDYAALITFIGEDISITNNDLISIQGDTAPVGANDSLTNIMIQSIAGVNEPTGSIDGLLIQNNTFTGNGKGYYGVYLNLQGAAVGTGPGDEVIIGNNAFTGNIWRAISTERSNVSPPNAPTSTSQTTLSRPGRKRWRLGAVPASPSAILARSQ
ncbi:MAG: hypothetical protein HYY48_03610, partial [Gammaproteobacteria bacterium]|nr:hypothetical protein [Gammaproteobacteria bacterium]